MNEWLTLKDVKKRKENYANAIDRYTEYIDNYNEMQRAIAQNKRLYKSIDFCNKIIEEMTMIIKELNDSNIITELQYSKGNYRILINGKYLYRKSLGE